MKVTQTIAALVNRYIGVDEGYLGDFTYKSHRDFYLEYCGLDRDPDSIVGTTRERFMSIYLTSSSKDQSRIILGALERFPTEYGPKTRNSELRKKLETEALRLSNSSLVTEPNLKVDSETVLEALEDARSLIEHRKVVSAVDRVHTALHGYLRNLCEEECISYSQKDDLVKLVKLLFSDHPKLKIATKSTEVQKIVRNLVSISDSLNPIRNQGSHAHPNKNVLEEAEATLVVNSVYSALTYLDAKAAS